MFKTKDTDGDGIVNEKQFIELVQALKIGVSEQKAR